MDNKTFFSSFSVQALTRRRPLTSRQEQRPPDQHHIQHDEQQQHRLHRKLGLSDLIFYGVGCSVGAGIYSLVGVGAHLAGPAIALSFFVCGMACIFTALCYAEFAARVPLAGSAYTYAYVSFGELCGWLVGWNLTLGYAVSSAVVARSWAEYSVDFFQQVASIPVPSWWTKFPVLQVLFGIESLSSYTCCPLAMVIINLCTLVLITGVKESTRFNTAMTLLNLSILGFVLLSGTATGSLHPDNLLPVFPHGLAGMARGSGLVFFSYLGFDMVACLSEEVKNPARNMPIGIVGSLVASMTIYVSVALVVVGMAPLIILGNDVPIVNALLANACCTHEQQLQDNAVASCLSYTACHDHPLRNPLLFWGSRVVSFGAIFGLTTATFSCLMGQPRIFYSMAQDGLLFKIYKRVHPRTGVPTIGCIVTGVFTGLVACFLDLATLANAISLGTLQVFTFVNAGVILLRMNSEDESYTRANPNEVQSLLQQSHTSPEIPQSPIADAQAAAVVRYLGLVKQPSWRIRLSTTTSLHSYYNIQNNGTKPVWLVLAYTMCAIGFAIVTSNATSDTSSVDKSHLLWIAVILLGGMFLSAGWLYFLPQSSPPDTFACPMVPTVPLAGILCNCYMMGSLPSQTWWIIAAWLSAGLAFYFAYGIHHSALNIHTPTAGKHSISTGRQCTTGTTSVSYHSI